MIRRLRRPLLAGASVALCFALSLPGCSLRRGSGRLGPEDGLLVVTIEGKYGYIDLNGRIVIPPSYDFAWQFSEGRASAWQNGRAGYIDAEGSFVITPRFEYARSFHEGLADVQVMGRWGFTDAKGTLVIPPRFEETQQFSEGRAAVRLNKQWGFVDTRGTLVIPAVYQQVKPFRNGRALVQSGGSWLAIDKQGQPTEDATALIPERRDGKWGFVTAGGAVSVEFQFDGAEPFSEGLAGVQVGDRWGFVDRFGRVIIPPMFEDGGAAPPGTLRGGPPVGRFSEGLAAVFKDGGWQFIDRTAKVILPGPFTKVSVLGFRNGVVEVCGTKSCGYMDRTGRVIWAWR